MSKTKIAIGVAVGLVILVGGLAVSLGYFSDSPEEVSIDAAVEAAGGEGEADEADSDAEPPADSAGAAADAEGGEVDGISGTWTVQPDEDVTFVGYRINEVLTTVGDFEVVGRTSDVSGTVEIDETTITSVSLVAQMDTLTTDSGRRDTAMRSQALETDQFPEATFVLTEPIELAELPADGETISVTATGDLTIHGVTQAVDFPLDAQRSGDLIVVVGQLQVELSDFAIDPPTAPIVASVEDTAILELSVAFGR